MFVLRNNPEWFGHIMLLGSNIYKQQVLSEDGMNMWKRMYREGNQRKQEQLKDSVEERLCLCTMTSYMSESVKSEIITTMLLQF